MFDNHGSIGLGGGGASEKISYPSEVRYPMKTFHKCDIMVAGRDNASRSLGISRCAMFATLFQLVAQFSIAVAKAYFRLARVISDHSR